MRRGWVPPILGEACLEKEGKGISSGDVQDDEWKSVTPVMELKPPSLIAPGLYVGSMADGADALWRSNPLGVTAVVNCAQEDWLHQVRKGRCGDSGSAAAAFTTELREAFDKLQEAPEGGARCGKVMRVAYLGFSAKDDASHIACDGTRPPASKSPAAAKAYMVSEYLPASMAFIGQHLDSGGKVLVHCLRGENRSAAVCAAFMIRERGMLCEAAIALLREKRGDNALSNQGFVEELRRLSPISPTKKPQPPSTTPPAQGSPQLPPFPSSPVKTPAQPSFVSDDSSPAPSAKDEQELSPATSADSARKSIACDLL